MPKKPKFEALSISCQRRGVLEYDKAYAAREAARKAAKRARNGWTCEITKSGSGVWSDAHKRRATFMTCAPSAKYDPRNPGAKLHAVCTMTPAFKKRVRGR